MCNASAMWTQTRRWLRAASADVEMRIGGPLGPSAACSRSGHHRADLVVACGHDWLNAEVAGVVLLLLIPVSSSFSSHSANAAAAAASARPTGAVVCGPARSRPRFSWLACAQRS